MVSALISAKDKGLGMGLIQIGPSECTSIKTIAELVVQASEKQIKIEYDTSKPEGDKGRCCNYQKAFEVLDWSPKVGIEEGLRELYNWALTRSITG